MKPTCRGKRQRVERAWRAADRAELRFVERCSSRPGTSPVFTDDPTCGRLWQTAQAARRQFAEQKRRAGTCARGIVLAGRKKRRS